MQKKYHVNISHHWHSLSLESIFTSLQTQEEGLSESLAKQRLAKYGYNRLPSPKPRHWIKRFLAQFNHALIYILLVAVCFTVFLGKWADASVILVMVLVNTVIGFVQEGKAEKALEAVRKMLPLQTTVMRSKKRFIIPAELLVPGDIVLLQPGDKVPADLRLINIKNLQINESMLTGESVSIEKTQEVFPEETSLADRTNMAFLGTLVTSGYGSGIVVGTGENTEIGRISELLTEIQPLTTPLLRKIENFSQWLSLIILSVATIIFLFGFFVRGYTLETMLMTAVGMAVAAIPEGLPIILTITLAIGVQRMARRHAIVRRLPAVETLGSVTVICTDKTGTLTRNEMTVKTVCMSGSHIDVTGVGYEPSGDFYFDGKLLNPLNTYPDFLELCKGAVLCNDAEFHDIGNELELHGDPTEGALIILGMKAGIERDLLRKTWPTTDIIPFESEHRFMATLHHNHEGNGIVYIKGAPEVILSRCYMERRGEKNYPIALNDWHKNVGEITYSGQRALAIACKSVSVKHQGLIFSDIDSDLVLLGVVGIIDPPRKEALAAIKECQSAGIRVKMITGDHAATANAIAAQMGIGDGYRVLTGGELEQLRDHEFLEQSLQVDVFARASPVYKLRLVEALQAQDQVIAMTGDGVNDAPALKRANIGVAMGLKGSEAAKEAAEMVIIDNNFASIVSAIKEGRTVYDNLKKVISFLLPINGGESGSLIIATLFGYTLPITPLQILWVNMISSVTLTMALAFEPSEPQIMARPPTPVHQPLLSPLLLWRITLVSLVFLAGIFGVFEWALYQGGTKETARTLAVNTLIVLEVCYLFSSRYIHGASLTLEGIRGTKAVFIAIGLVCLLQALFTYAPFMHILFKSEPLSFMQCIFIGIIGITAFFILEIDKLVFLGIKRYR
ncbi:MAG: hypothetical protein K0Q74_1404, partial [Gammaproteobacteria bacterium]|nr:hypothetical protein [Gammaproteobacteria bacterium]